MKITEKYENLFDTLVPGDILAHGANCKGIMGGGVAKPIKDMFPANYRVYNMECRKDRFKPGDILPFREKGYVIYNCGTQYELGADAKIENVRVSVRAMVAHAEAYKVGTKIKTFRLGCGIGGLDWAKVKPVLERIKSDVELEVYYIER